MNNIGFPKPSKTKKTSSVSRWANDRKWLKTDFMKRGITTCEMCAWEHRRGIAPTFCYILSFAHRHKRDWYLSCPELLRNFLQVILACQAHHSLIEYDKELTNVWFERLRGPETNLENQEQFP